MFTVDDFGNQVFPFLGILQSFDHADRCYGSACAYGFYVMPIGGVTVADSLAPLQVNV